MFNDSVKPLNAGLPIKTEEKRGYVFWFAHQITQEKFCCDEEEAWNILNGRIKIFNGNGQETVRHKYLGRTDSNLYFDGLKEMNKIFKEQGLEKAQEFLRELVIKESDLADKTYKPRNQDIQTQSTVPGQIGDLSGLL